MADRTALGTLTAGVGWTSVLLGLLAGSLAPALIGIALLAYAEGARLFLGAARIEAERALPERATIDDELTAELTVTTEPSLPVRVRDRVPAGLRLVGRETASATGTATDRTHLVPEEPGLARWHEVDLQLADPWGLFAIEQTQAVPSVLRVAPEGRWAAQGRSAGRAHPVESLAKNRKAYESVPEIEHIREYQPGDRVRDIDWARTSRMQGLFTKQRERVGPRPIVILMDATPSMRYKRRRSKLSTASRLAYGLAAAAEGAGVTATLVAFNEHGVAASGSLEGNRRPVVETLERLSSMEGAFEVDRVPIAKETGSLPSPEERGFLQALSPFVKGPAPSSTPLESALSLLGKRASTPAFVVAILDGEESPRMAQVALQRLTRAKHQVVLVVPATGAHHYTRREARGAVLDDLVEARARRERLTRAAKAHDVQVIPLIPGDERAVLEEVVASAQ